MYTSFYVYGRLNGLIPEQKAEGKKQIPIFH